MALTLGWPGGKGRFVSMSLLYSLGFERGTNDPVMVRSE